MRVNPSKRVLKMTARGLIQWILDFSTCWSLWPVWFLFSAKCSGLSWNELKPFWVPGLWAWCLAGKSLCSGADNSAGFAKEKTKDLNAAFLASFKRKQRGKKSSTADVSRDRGIQVKPAAPLLAEADMCVLYSCMKRVSTMVPRCDLINFAFLIGWLENGSCFLLGYLAPVLSWLRLLTVMEIHVG